MNLRKGCSSEQPFPGFRGMKTKTGPGPFPVFIHAGPVLLFAFWDSIDYNTPEREL